MVRCARAGAEELDMETGSSAMPLLPTDKMDDAEVAMLMDLLT